MKKLKTLILSAVAIIGFGLTPLVVNVPTAGALTPAERLCDGSGGTWVGGADGSCTNANEGNSLEGFFRTIVNILLFVIGAVSVIMIVIGGIKYVVSGGDSAQVTSAKNTILYAVIGLVVAILGYAIVEFVVNSLVSGASKSTPNKFQ